MESLLGSWGVGHRLNGDLLFAAWFHAAVVCPVVFIHGAIASVVVQLSMSRGWCTTKQWYILAGWWATQLVICQLLYAYLTAGWHGFLFLVIPTLYSMVVCCAAGSAATSVCRNIVGKASVGLIVLDVWLLQASRV